MNDFDEVIRMLTNRFREVPNLSVEDLESWTETALLEFGIKRGDRIPPPLIPLILLHAEADGASQIALKTAHYFKFTDKDETIDKSKISENYRQISSDMWKRYRLKKDEGVEGYGGAVMKFMRRVDRP